ncbi:hypothetical protein B9Z19DRAFT_1060748 [Tuber borchii]|uniref:Uncharacterized protein n=1 Tax=Tuber borchii TaxID=42251 RepID=A0A2T7A801_TUBBO|nr:hypothetical protein B9Z19DRAFT_1060748 [Tuber borchii]
MCAHDREETPDNFTPPRTGYSVSCQGISSVFYPKIAVATSDGAQLITVVAPSSINGNENCQLVGFLLGVAQKHFSECPSSSICAVNLIRLTDTFVVYFAKAWVTRAYLASVCSGMDGVDDLRLRVHISDAFDLGVVTERIRFVHTLTDLYQTALDNAGPILPLNALELE